MNKHLFVRRIVGLIWLVLIAINPVVNAAEKPDLAVNVSLSEIEKTIEHAMKTFEVPGVAVAIVKGDQLVMAKGFGVREMGTTDKVTADTLFGIASNSKAFTAAAIAMLVDQGKLNWDDKVIDHLPQFQLYDANVTHEFTIRDLLSHRSGLGLGAGDLMIWPTSDISNQEILARIRYLHPKSSFRSEYAYVNLMFVVAGELVAKVSGMSWHDFIRTQILQPLNMSATRMKFSDIEASNHNVATAHAPVDGVLGPVGGDFLETFSAAGSIASNVKDMSRWLTVQLKGGLIATVDGKEQRLFSEKSQQQMWKPHTLQGVNPILTKLHRTHFRAYGLGWGLNDYQGYKMVGHTGGIMGMVSKVVMIPEIELGVVILTNQQSGSAFNAIATDIVNRYLGVAQQDWVEIYHQRLLKANAEDAETVARLMKNREAKSKPSLALSGYAQTYHDDWYGDIIISQNKDKSLEMRFSRTPVLVGKLEHYQYNTFIVRWYDRSTNADAFVNFQLGIDGRVERATMEAVSPEVDFSFDFQDLNLIPKYK